MTTLMMAREELFRRSPDERFASLADLHQRCIEDKRLSTERWHRPGDIRPVPTDKGWLQLAVGEDGNYRPNDWSFGQLCKLAGVSKETVNPAASVRGPRHVVKRGKTPVLTGPEAKALLESIDVSTVVGLRDRALIGVMIYSFARVSAVLRMKVRDYFPAPGGKRWWLRLHEKGGKHHEVPAHHLAEAYLDAYLDAAGTAGNEDGPLFRSANGRTGRFTELAMDRRDALRMIKRRSRAAGLAGAICCHTFRATGITAYLENGGTVENAQAIAAHESPRTTKLYDRRGDEISLKEIERIRL